MLSSPGSIIQTQDPHTQFAWINSIVRALVWASKRARKILEYCTRESRFCDRDCHHDHVNGTRLDRIVDDMLFNAGQPEALRQITDVLLQSVWSRPALLSPVGL